MRTLSRATLSAIFLLLFGGLAFLALAPPAFPQGVAAKGDRLEAPEYAAIPPKDDARVPTPCKLPFWYLAELPGWRILEGKQAKAYLKAAFDLHPPADAVAFTVSGGKAALVLAKDGCVVGRQMLTAEVHAKVMIRAFGFPV